MKFIPHYIDDNKQLKQVSVITKNCAENTCMLVYNFTLLRQYKL